MGVQRLEGRNVPDSVVGSSKEPRKGRETGLAMSVGGQGKGGCFCGASLCTRGLRRGGM